MFKKFEIEGWRQFENIEIDFHDRLTILTGANGSGKTTVLNILNRHFGWDIGFISTPKRDKKREALSYAADVWRKITKTFKTTQDIPPDHRVIGKIIYSDEQVALLSVPGSVTQIFKVDINQMKAVPGLHIPEHRPTYFYQTIKTIPTTPPTRNQMFDRYSNQIRTRYSGGHTEQSASYFIKESLISLALFGQGNDYVTPIRKALETFEGFQEILRIVMPPKLKFKKLLIEHPEVMLVTKYEQFSFDSISGGIAAIIDLAWQIYMRSAEDEACVVTIDEPENHLHPELQKTLLSNFLKAFPKYQFIVSTHNPFIVTSVPDSNVYVFKYNEHRKVESLFLENIDKAGSSNEVLREVLGLSTASPIWVENKIKDIISKYSKMKFEDKTLKLLRNEMEEIGLEDVVPETIVEVKKKIK